MRLKSIFLLLFFTAFILTPAAISFSNPDSDIASFFSIGEEEEKGSEKTIEIETLISKGIENSFVSNAFDRKNNFDYCFKKYAKPFLNSISPPPKFTS